MFLLTIYFFQTGMSMISVHLLDFKRSIRFYLSDSISFNPVKMEIDGGDEGGSPSFAARSQLRTELFSEAHRFSRTTVTPVTMATSGRELGPIGLRV